MFNIGDMQKQMGESKERWKRMDELLEEVQKMSVYKDSKLVELITLVIEQMRPAYSPEALEKSMQQVMDALTGGNANDK